MPQPVHRGGCLCGGVRYDITGPMRGVVFCHCAMCRIQGGTATVGVAREEFRFVESRSLKSYASSAAVTRWFCSSCGSCIYWDPAGEPFLAVFAGSLDQPTGLRGLAHVHVEDKPDYYEITDDVKQFHGPENYLTGSLGRP
jgi:hypothetical protein